MGDAAAALKAVINDQKMNHPKSVEHTERRIDRHSLFQPATADTRAKGYFVADRRMNSITTTDLTAFVAQRLETERLTGIGIMSWPSSGARSGARSDPASC